MLKSDYNLNISFWQYAKNPQMIKRQYSIISLEILFGTSL